MAQDSTHFLHQNSHHQVLAQERHWEALLGKRKKRFSLMHQIYAQFCASHDIIGGTPMISSEVYERNCNESNFYEGQNS